jgi:hypothetical protein
MQDSNNKKKSVVNMMLTLEWIVHYNTINTGAAVVCLQMLKRRPLDALACFLPCLPHFTRHPKNNSTE